MYAVKYCSSVFGLLNTVKYILNKDLSTPLIYICFYCVQNGKDSDTKIFIALQFFSIALAHFSIHCLLLQNSSNTALNRSWNDQNTLWYLQNDTTFSKLITHPSKPNISIKTYNLCSIENVGFLIYLTMYNKTQTTAININLCNHHFNFCAAPSQYWLFYHWQRTTIWVLYWALLLREYTVRKYLFTVKYCSTVFVLLNTVKYIVNKVLSTHCRHLVAAYWNCSLYSAVFWILLSIVK